MKRKTKRFLAMLLAFTMTFSLAGSEVAAASVLGKDPGLVTEQTTEEPAEVVTEEEVTVTEETEAEEEKIPYQEDIKGSGISFEGEGLPEGWTVVADPSGYAWTVEEDDAYDGAQDLLTHSVQVGAETWLLSPRMNFSVTPICKLGFHFYNQLNNGSSDALGVYYRVGDGEWKALYETTKSHESWTEANVVLPQEALTANVQLGFKATDRHGYGVALDEITVLGMSGTVYSVIYHPNMDDMPIFDGGAYMAGGDFVVADGLAPRNGMHFCGWCSNPNGQGTVYAPGDHVVAQNDKHLYALWAENQSTLSEGFENGIPASWKIESNCEGYDWVSGRGDNSTATGSHGGRKNAKITNVCKTASSWLVTEPLDLAAAQTVTLDFWFINAAWSGDIDGLEVAYRVDGGAWNTVYETNQAHEEWTEVQLTLPGEARANNVEIGFRATDHFGYGIGLDDVLVETSDVATYVLRYDANGGSGVMVDQNSPYESGATATVLQNGFLAPAGGYKFLCWNESADGNGRDRYPGDTFTMTQDVTLYAQWENLGIQDHFSENFDGENAAEGWTFVDADEDGRNWFVHVNGAGESLYAHSGNGVLASKSYDMDEMETLTPDNWAISPAVAIPGSGFVSRLSFWLRGQDPYYVEDKMAVYVGTSTDLNSMVKVGGDYVATKDYVNYEIDLTAYAGQNVYIAFRHYNCSDMYCLLLDDIVLYSEPIEELTVTYNANGGSGEMIDPNGAYHKKQVVTVLENEFTAPKGKRFTEWNTAADGSGISYQPGDTFTITKSVTLYAQWYRLPKNLNESFEQGIPGNWTVLADEAKPAYAWVCGVGDSDETTGAHDGAKNAKITHVARNATSWLISPVLNLSDITSGKLNFYYINRAKSGAADGFAAYYRIDGGDWVKMFSTTKAHESWTKQSVSIPTKARVEGVEIGFLATDNNGNGVALDGVEITTAKANAVMKSAVAALDGKLGIVYYLELPTWLVEDQDAYLTFTQNDVTKTKMLSEVVAGGPNDNNQYRMAYYMPAAYYADEVTLHLYEGGGEPVVIKGGSGTDYTETGLQYSIKRYVDAQKNSSDELVKNLAQAIDDYCIAAKVFFKYNNEGYSVSSAVDGVTPEMLSGYRSVREGNPTPNLDSVGLNASFDSDNALKISVNFKKNKPKNVQFFIDDQPATLHGSKANGYYLSVRNIPAVNLDQAYKFTVKEGNASYSITCSVMTYARAMAFGEDEALGDLVKALYLYNKASKEYFLR